VNSPQWSPDGAELAFVSNRGDHSFIGIYDTRSNYIRFKSPSVDRDVAPRWSPDGKRIAFIRLFNINDTFSMDRERLQPWAILVADRVGDAKQVWRSGDQDNDSFPGIGSEDSGSGPPTTVWCSIGKDGWLHLYSIGADGAGFES
jgi:Tol biopolymer transport system component